MRLALALHPSSRGLGLEVTSRDGRVTLSGPIPQAQLASHATERWMGELRKVAEDVPGVKGVELDLDVVRKYR